MRSAVWSAELIHYGERATSSALLSIIVTLHLTKKLIHQNGGFTACLGNSASDIDDAFSDGVGRFYLVTGGIPHSLIRSFSHWFHFLLYCSFRWWYG